MKNACFPLLVAMLLGHALLIPPIVWAQHGPGMHAARPGATYDPKSELTFKGAVTEVKTGRSVLYWITQIHTMGLGQRGRRDQQLLVKTDTGTVRVHLGPSGFLSEQKVDIRKGDAVEVTGSLVTIGDSHAVLAREIKKGDTAWNFRDATGQPLWSTAPPERRGFWTTKKVLIAAVAIKVALLATVLNH
jgi:hypothetical protein